MLNNEALKSLLEEKRIRPAHLSRMTSTPRNSMHRYLNGDAQPGLSRIMLFAEALEVPAEALIAADTVAKPPASKPTKRKMCFCPFCGESLKGVPG